MSADLSALQAEVAFLKGYLGLPCKSRQIAAQHWLGVFRTTDDALLRKTALIKILEEFVASTEDLCMFYFAMKRLGDAPAGVIPFCDKFQVFQHEAEWQELMDAIAPEGHIVEEFLARIDRLAPMTAFAFDRPKVEPIFRKLTTALRAAAFTRHGANRVIVTGTNKVRHGVLILDEGDTIVLDVTRPEITKFPVSEANADMMATGVTFMRQATAMIVDVIFLTMHLAVSDKAYNLTDAETVTLLAAFEGKLPTF